MRHVSVVSVPVSDQERAKRFYVDVLGFEVVADAPFGDGRRWLQVRPGSEGATLTLVTWFDEMPAGSLRGLVVDVDDIAAEHRALRDRGAPVAEEPAATDGGTFLPVPDPDGNVLLFHQA